jgi:hypothetical protein
MRPGRSTTIQRAWTGNTPYTSFAGYQALKAWEQKWVDDYITKTAVVSTQKQWKDELNKLNAQQVFNFMTHAEAVTYFEQHGHTLTASMFEYFLNKINAYVNLNTLPNPLALSGAPHLPNLPASIKAATGDAFPLTNGHAFRGSTAAATGTAIRIEGLATEAASNRSQVHEGIQKNLCLACAKNVPQDVMQSDHQVAWSILCGKLATLVLYLNQDAATAATVATTWGPTFAHFFTSVGGTYKPKACFASDYSNNRNNLLLICASCNTLGAKNAASVESVTVPLMPPR